jgi:hypothetical protein
MWKGFEMNFKRFVFEHEATLLEMSARGLLSSRELELLELVGLKIKGGSFK